MSISSGNALERDSFARGARTFTPEDKKGVFVERWGSVAGENSMSWHLLQGNQPKGERASEHRAECFPCQPQTKDKERASEQDRGGGGGGGGGWHSQQTLKVAKLWLWPR